MTYSHLESIFSEPTTVSQTQAQVQLRHDFITSYYISIVRITWIHISKTNEFNYLPKIISDPVSMKFESCTVSSISVPSYKHLNHLGNLQAKPAH